MSMNRNKNATPLAIRQKFLPRRAFDVTVTAEGQKLELTVLAARGVDALVTALNLVPEGFSVAISVWPVGLPENVSKRAGIHDVREGRLVYTDIFN
jgi:hypothetical protein